MNGRPRRYAIPNANARALLLLRAAACAILLFSAGGFSFSRPSSRAPEFSRRFELAVRELRDESVYDARTDSVTAQRFESTLAHFGRIAPNGRAPSPSDTRGPREKSPATARVAYSVFSDSLVFRSDAPFRYAALFRRDTLAVTSMEKGPSTRAAVLDTDREMLACIFEGPALRVAIPGKGGAARIDNLKNECPGGLYRRVNLPATLGAFIFPVPSGMDRPGARWEAPTTCPSYAGLGLSPGLILTYAIAKDPSPDGAPLQLALACDTAIANVRTVTPAGDTVDIVSHRIRVRGLLQPWDGLRLFHTGELTIEEDVRYVRPDLASPVLEKRCRVEILLEPR